MLALVPDPVARGRRYQLVFVLTVAVACALVFRKPFRRNVIDEAARGYARSGQPGPRHESKSVRLVLAVLGNWREDRTNVGFLPRIHFPVGARNERAPYATRQAGWPGWLHGERTCAIT